MSNPEILKTVESMAEILKWKTTGDERELCASAAEIISGYIHHKLEPQTILSLIHILGGLIAGEGHPEYDKDDVLRVQGRRIEEVPAAAGKLNHREKEALAFCVYLMTQKEMYSSRTNTLRPGLERFTSHESIDDDFRIMKMIAPALFDADPEAAEPDRESYGLSPENPVQLLSIPDVCAYLGKLCYKGLPVMFKRLGSLPGPKEEGHILDCYLLGFFADSSREVGLMTLTIYIDSYAERNLLLPPPGFTLED